MVCPLFMVVVPPLRSIRKWIEAPIFTIHRSVHKVHSRISVMTKRVEDALAEFCGLEVGAPLFVVIAFLGTGRIPERISAYH